MAAVIPAVTRLSARVIRILGCNPGPMTLQGTNTYLIGTGKKRVLLDAGDEDVPEYVRNLNDVVKTENVDIAHVIVTHWHHDHIGGVKNLYEHLKPDCKIWKHRRSAEDDPDDQLPSHISLDWLEDGQTVRVEGATLVVRHAPGHTTDHVVLTLREDRVLFSGDCILGEGTAVFEDLHAYMESLNKILNIEPSVIYPGHGNVVEEPISKIEYYIQHRNRRENQILDVLREKKVAMNEIELVETIYSETPKNLWPAAAVNVNHHLTKLAKERKVIQIAKDDGNKWQYRSQSLL